MLSKKIVNRIFIAACISGMCACAPALYIPSPKTVAAGLDLHELQAGRQLYISKCGSCHALVLPEKHTNAQWPLLVDRMEKKSKISPEEKKLILNYLTKGDQ